MTKHEELKKPEKSAADVAHTVTKAGLSAIPLVGGPAAILFNEIIIPPLARRRDEWVESVAERLKKLEEKVEGFKIENLSDNESFVTSVMQATQSAIRNHQEEKLKALRNAVLNSALPTAPEENKQAIFLNLIDEFTPLHLEMLSMYKNITDAKTDGTVNKFELQIIIDTVFPDFKDNVALYSVIIGDLASRELVRKDYAGTFADNIDTHYAARITRMGIEFLDFISSPLEDDK